MRSSDGKKPEQRPAWVGIVGQQLFLLFVLLVVLVGLRLIGPVTRLWFDQAILWSILAMFACWVCFSAATVVDHLGRRRSQPISGPLTAIGLRTGGVAITAVIAVVAVDKEVSRWFLASLVSFYIVALIVHTLLWSKVLKESTISTDTETT